MRAMTAAVLAILPFALAGCTEDGKTGTVEDGIRVIDIHIGWNEDGQSQYMRPETIRVSQGDKVQFRVTNDDDPAKDYNGAGGGRDNFHDVALLDYDGDGDGIEEDIEHEVPAGTTETTSLKGNPYFIASEKGTFRIICEVRTQPSHDQLGMHAEFIVE
jgi:plastocyanin